MLKSKITCIIGYVIPLLVFQIIFPKENVVFSLLFPLIVSVPAEEHGPLTPEEVHQGKEGRKTLPSAFARVKLSFHIPLQK